MTYQTLSREQPLPSEELAECEYWEGWGVGVKPLPTINLRDASDDALPNVEETHRDLLQRAYRAATPIVSEEQVEIVNAGQSLNDVDCPEGSLMQLVIDKRFRGAAAQKRLPADSELSMFEDTMTKECRKYMRIQTFDHDAASMVAHETAKRPPHNLRVRLGVLATDGVWVIERSLIYVRPTQSGKHVQTSPSWWEKNAELRSRRQSPIPRSLSVRVPYVSEGAVGADAVRLVDARILYPVSMPLEPERLDLSMSGANFGNNAVYTAN